MDSGSGFYREETSMYTDPRDSMLKPFPTLMTTYLQPDGPLQVPEELRGRLFVTSNSQMGGRYMTPAALRPVQGRGNDMDLPQGFDQPIEIGPFQRRVWRK
jgi:hypothetical protein